MKSRKECERWKKNPETRGFKWISIGMCCLSLHKLQIWGGVHVGLLQTNTSLPLDKWIKVPSCCCAWLLEWREAETLGVLCLPSLQCLRAAEVALGLSFSLWVMQCHLPPYTVSLGQMFWYTSHLSSQYSFRGQILSTVSICIIQKSRFFFLLSLFYTKTTNWHAVFKIIYYLNKVK